MQNGDHVVLATMFQEAKALFDIAAPNWQTDGHLKV